MEDEQSVGVAASVLSVTAVLRLDHAELNNGHSLHDALTESFARPLSYPHGKLGSQRVAGGVAREPVEPNRLATDLDS